LFNPLLPLPSVSPKPPPLSVVVRVRVHGSHELNTPYCIDEIQYPLHQGNEYHLHNFIKK
jgi:hypothetical protein